MTTSQVATDQPEEFRASGESPPAVIPPQLAEELARIIARALVADYYAGLAKTSPPTSTS